MKIKKIMVQRMLGKFFDGVKDWTETYNEIYVNPTKKEISQIIENTPENKNLRFIATAKPKKVYVVTSNVLHRPLLKVLKKKIKLKAPILLGALRFTSGKFTVFKHELSESLQNSIEYYGLITEVEQIESIFTTDWSWLDKYFGTLKINSTLKPMQKKLVNKAKRFLKEAT